MSDDDAVLYRTRPDWSDVTPVKQDEPLNPVVAIDYSEEFEDTMDYFRAVHTAGEFSERALEITAKVISMNGASCTAWQHRWLCLQALNSDLFQELTYLDELADRYPKNYQLWHHRRMVTERLGSSAVDRELQATQTALEEEPKNYHVWQYRQWLVRTHELWDADLKLVNELIQDDIRNNSAWNERYFILTRGGKDPAHLESVRDFELHYVSEMIRLAPGNESAWNYARALPPEGVNAIVPLATEISQKSPNNIHALSVLVDSVIERIGSKSDNSSNEETSLPTKEFAHTLLHRLMEVDPIRMRYWVWCSKQLVVS